MFQKISNQKILNEELQKIANVNWNKLISQKKKSLSKDEFKEFLIYKDAHKQVLLSPMKEHYTSKTGYNEHIYHKFEEIADSGVEKLQLLCFDSNKELLSSEVIIEGEYDRVDFDFKIICQKLLENHNTTYFMLNHNHPLCTGAKLSFADKNVAFYCARLGEMLGIYMLDFLVVTKYDVLSLKVDEKDDERKIINFENIGVFNDISMLNANKELYYFLSALRNKREKIQNRNIVLNEITTDKDIGFLGLLLNSMIAKTPGSKRDEIIRNVQDIVDKWK